MISSPDYFMVSLDPELQGSWFLGAPIDENDKPTDPWVFSTCTCIDRPGKLKLPIEKTGLEMPFSLASYAALWVVSRQVIDALKKELDVRVQGIPVEIAGARGEYEILNILDCVDCIDESRSEFIRWKSTDGRPDRTGQIRMMFQIELDARRVQGHHLFRLRDYKSAVICSKECRDILRKMVPSCLVFIPVT